MLSLRRHLEDFGLLYLHWVHGWLDTCVRNLFTGSRLDPVLRFFPTAECRNCVSSTCCAIFGTLTIFSNCGYRTSMICSPTRATYTFHLSALNLHWDAVYNPQFIRRCTAALAPVKQTSLLVSTICSWMIWTSLSCQRHCRSTLCTAPQRRTQRSRNPSHWSTRQLTSSIRSSSAPGTSRPVPWRTR